MDQAIREAQRFKLIAELRSLGIAMRRAALRADHPDWTRARVDREICRWLGYEGFGELDDPDLIERPPRVFADPCA
jgi:hypothetical protein